MAKRRMNPPTQSWAVLDLTVELTRADDGSYIVVTDDTESTVVGFLTADQVRELSAWLADQVEISKNV